VSRKHISSYYNEADDDDFVLLGSRFMHAVQDHDRQVAHRSRRETDGADRNGPRAKPRPVRDRSY